MLVGYTASGLNDAKPTPVDPAMPGVAVLAEATEALIAGSAIRMPPAWLKYALAALMTLFTTYAFFRGEPHNDIDSVFVASNVLLLAASFVGLTFFRFYFDIFAAVGFISVVFGLCRMYAKTRSADTPSGTAITCRSSIRRRIAGSRWPACTSYRTRRLTAG